MGDRYWFDSISWGLITIFNNGKIIPMDNISKTAFNNASNKFIQICNFLLKLRYLYKWISKLNEFDGFLLINNKAIKIDIANTEEVTNWRKDSRAIMEPSIFLLIPEIISALFVFFNSTYDLLRYELRADLHKSVPIFCESLIVYFKFDNLTINDIETIKSVEITIKYKK